MTYKQKAEEFIRESEQGKHQMEISIKNWIKIYSTWLDLQEEKKCEHKWTSLWKDGMSDPLREQCLKCKIGRETNPYTGKIRRYMDQEDVERYGKPTPDQEDHDCHISPEDGCDCQKPKPELPNLMD